MLHTVNPTPETVLRDPSGDVLELLQLDEGLYVTVDQGGVLATVGPFPKDSLR